MAGRDPKRKRELLAGFVGYVLKNGLADLSLRPAASALGTSPQILLYYFGSKEKLISQAIAEARMQQAAMLSQEVARGRAGESPSKILWRVWRWFTDERQAPFSRFFFEVNGLALQHPERFPEFLSSGRDFYAVVEGAFAGSGFTRARSRAMATVYLDTLRGFLLDYLMTGDRARIDAAVALVERNLTRDLTDRRSPPTRPRRRVPRVRAGRRAMFNSR